MGEAFSQAGYHSHIVGKWHQDNASMTRSFDSGARIMVTLDTLFDTKFADAAGQRPGRGSVVAWRLVWRGGDLLRLRSLRQKV